MRRMTRRIPDILLVTLVTALIWLYAESRNVQTLVPAEPVPVHVALTAADMVVTEQEPRRVTVRFKGAQSELDRLRRRLAEGLHVELAATDPGRREVALAEALREARPLAEVNVNLTGVEPATMSLTLDRLVHVPANVGFDPDEVRLAAGSLSIEPAEVQLTLPGAALERLGGDAADLTLQAEPIVELHQLAAGIEHTGVRARVRLPAELAEVPHVRVQPRDVSLSFTIDKREEQTVLASVPVWAAMPPAEIGRFRVEIDPESRVLRDVAVSGPAELVRRVEERDIRVIALLRLSSDDLAQAAGAEAVGTVTFDLPPQLTAESPTTTVTYTVTRLEE